MKKKQFADFYKYFRISMILIGLIAGIIAISADWLGLDSSKSIGRGEFLLFVLSLVSIIAGIFGRKIVGIYKSTAIIIMNLIIILILLEFTAVVIFSFRHQMIYTGGTSLSLDYSLVPYYQKQSWSEKYWREYDLATDMRYHPFTIWRRKAFEGDLINVSEYGIRRTPGADFKESCYTVFALGGSTMWGAGSPNWGTISAFLQKELEKFTDKPVCVINYGESAYVSTQGLIELIRQLQVGNVPDLVIFYDGFNDVYAAYQSGQKNGHQNLGDISAKFEGRENTFIKLMKTSNLIKLINKFLSRSEVNIRTYQNGEIETDRLTDAITSTYLSNYTIVKSLATEYSFEYFFFWHPVISVGEKPLTENEIIIKSRLAPTLVDLLDSAYEKIVAMASDYKRLYYIADVLDANNSQIWIDKVHVIPDGNQIIARKMHEIIKQELKTE